MAGKVKIEMLVESWSTHRGDVVSVDKDTAEALIRNGKAVAVSAGAKKIEDE